MDSDDKVEIDCTSNDISVEISARDSPQMVLKKNLLSRDREHKARPRSYQWRNKMCLVSNPEPPEKEHTANGDVS